MIQSIILIVICETNYKNVYNTHYMVQRNAGKMILQPDLVSYQRFYNYIRSYPFVICEANYKNVYSTHYMVQRNAGKMILQPDLVSYQRFYSYIRSYPFVICETNYKNVYHTHYMVQRNAGKMDSCKQDEKRRGRVQVVRNRAATKYCAANIHFKIRK